MKYIFTLYMVICMLCSSGAVFAFTVDPEVLLVPSVHAPVGIAEQFYVDVMLDAHGVRFNGIEGSVIFSPTEVSFVRAEVGTSLIGLWITNPSRIDSRTISFSGIIPNGFDGVIDPFNPVHKLPGQIVRLVFEGAKAGNVQISLYNIKLTRNDGLGTEVEPVTRPLSIIVENSARPYTYTNTQKSVPTLDAHVVHVPNLFDGKYVLVYQAVDRGSGIATVRLREGESDWKSIESPYVLSDQSRRSVLALEATNVSGESVVVVINPLPYHTATMYTIYTVLVVLALFVLSIFYVRKKNIHTN